MNPAKATVIEVPFINITATWAAELNLYWRYPKILLPAYQATTASNFLEFDKLSSIYFCY